jgi:membrane-bound serine protease (ClpP class)
MRALLALLLALSPALARSATVYVATVDAEISPAIGDYVATSIARATAEGADALVIQLDTPGGLVTTTQEIVSSILNAELPVIVFVAPRGAWAASAGTFITLAGHVAAMAPGTSIGAAHPVPIFGTPPPMPDPGKPSEPGGKKPERAPAPRDFALEKTENFTAAFIESIAELRGRNVEWAVEAVRNSVAVDHAEALAKKVIDLVAEDLPQLLELASGRVVKVGRREVELQLADARVVELPMSAVQKLFSVLASPQLAFILLLAGLAGIYIETQSPGLIVPGALGVACLVLVGISLSIIPFDWVGLILVLAGIALMVGEIFVAGFGLLFVPGLILFGAGAYLVFRVPELSDLSLPFWQFVVPVVGVFGALGALLVWGVSRSFARPQVAGTAGLIGTLGIADLEVGPGGGRVLLRGELWSARSEQPIAAGEPVEVEGLDGLTLRVRSSGKVSPGRV